MASIYQFKPAFQKLLQPALQILIKRGITPNQITMASILLSCFGGWVILMTIYIHGLLLLVPLLLLIRMALNALDGMLARSQNLSSPSGEVLNEVGDIVSDGAFYLPLIVLTPVSLGATLLIVAFVFLGGLSEFCGILAKALTGERRYDGPMGKSDRAFAVGLFCLLYFFIPTSFTLIVLYFLILNGMLIRSCWNRLRPILQSSSSS